MGFPTKPWADGQAWTQDGVRRLYQTAKNRWRIDAYTVGGSTRSVVTSEMIAPGAVRPQHINLAAVFGLTAPPEPPLLDRVYVPSTPATGAFSGRENHIGWWDGLAWSWVPSADRQGIALIDVATGFVRGWNSTAGAWNVSNGPKGDAGAPGAQGLTGPKGDPGTAAQGVPAGGTTGQVLKKLSNFDYNTAWVDENATPGSTGLTIDAITGTGVGALIPCYNSGNFAFPLMGSASTSSVANVATFALDGTTGMDVTSSRIVANATYKSLGATGPTIDVLGAPLTYGLIMRTA